MNPGVVYAALAYVIWGLFPLYLKTLQAVPAAQILSHRIVWSLVFIGANGAGWPMHCGNRRCCWSSSPVRHSSR
jgi:hypothetical protein